MAFPSMEGKDPEGKPALRPPEQHELPHASKGGEIINQNQAGVGARSARYFALAEQSLISGSNFLLYVYAARVLPKDQWGSLSFTLAFLLVLQGFQRAFVTVPMATSGDRHGVFGDSLRFWRQMQGWITGFTLLLLLGFYAIARHYLDAWVAQSILLTAVLVVPLYYMEFARRVIIVAFSMHRLVIMAAIYAVVLLIAGAVAHMLSIEWHISDFVLAMAMAALISCLSARVNLWPTTGLHDGGSWSVFSLWRFGRWAAASTLAFVGYTFAIQAILAAMAGPAALGVFAAARNLTQPVATLIQAIDSVDKPRAGHAYALQGMPGLWHVIRSSWKWLFILALPYLTLLGIFSESLLVVIYGEKYADAAVSVQFWVVVMLVVILAHPLETGLYVIRRPDWLFYGRAFSAALVLLLTPWLVRHWSVQGALVALAAGWGLAGASAMWLLVKISRQVKPV